jgi:ureidoacrylate peracid hydrolase
MTAIQGPGCPGGGDARWLDLFDRMDPAQTALVVIDMQSTFCAPGSPAEVPAWRDIVEPVTGLTAELRGLGVPVFWVPHANNRARTGNSKARAPA